MELPFGEEWVWVPVSRGWCKAESIFNGELDLEAFARMNDAIRVHDHNVKALHTGAAE